MSYIICDNCIEVRDEFFVPKHTLECGQLFRYEETPDGYVVYAGNRRAILSTRGDTVIIGCDDTEYFRRYFDLDTDYSSIRTRIADGGIISEAENFGKGIRILKQELFETVMSFIISANNHIPRIKRIISRICRDLGDDMGGYRAFPSPEKMCVGEDYYKEIGAGYRAAYLAESARAIADGALEEIEQADTESAGAMLMKLKGVGRKVADCILLFGLGRTNLFPIDTWTRKVYNDYYGGGKDARSFFLNKFGSDAGYAQQYLYYYKRELEKYRRV
ncbi:MAG: DNA-3-methyladenine glycosylase family protein [Christensenellales bacterium]